jgi:DNA polymerase III delta subunit
MPIILFHGNGLTAISRAVSQFRSKFDSLAISDFNGKNQSFEQVLMALGTIDLFSNARLVILENFSEKTDLSLIQTDDKTTVLIRSQKALGAASILLKSAKSIGAQIQEFSEADEISIFPFLDLLGDKKQLAYVQLEKVYVEYGSQYILTMLYYFYRRMLVIPKKTPSFALQKLERQKQNFPKEIIQQLYQFTLEIDFKIKSGLIDEKIGLLLIIERILKD